MTLTQIKAQLGIVSLDLVRGVDKDSKPTAWLRFWDNTRRVAVVLHEDVVATIKANPSMDKLALKTNEKTTKTGTAMGTVYTEHIIINAKSIEYTL
jgi:hypothetical protein